MTEMTPSPYRWVILLLAGPASFPMLAGMTSFPLAAPQFGVFSAVGLKKTFNGGFGLRRHPPVS